MLDIFDGAVHNFATAIVRQAVLDYHHVLRKGDGIRGARTELEKSFHSEFFALATNGYPPKLFMKQIQRGESYLTQKADRRRTGQLNKNKAKGERCFG